MIGGCTAFHRPSIDNVFFGGINAQATGDVPMTSYIDLPDTVTVDAVPAGTTGTGSSTQATIYCTVLVGNIFSYSWHSYVEVAWTWGSRIPQEPPTERLAGRPLTRLFGKYGFILLLPREGIWCLLAGFVLGIGLAGGAVHWLAVVTSSRFQASACPFAVKTIPAKLSMGPVGPCSPGIHCG